MSQIDISQWKEFKLAELFEPHHGKRLTKRNRVPGEIPFLTAGFDNQGVKGYLAGNFEIWHNPISIDMFGNCFYQECDCTGDDNVYALVNNAMTSNVKLFIAGVLNKQLSIQFSYKDQFRQHDLDVLSIKLPADSAGNPDWQYMNTYIAKLTALAHKNVSSLKKAKAKPVKLNIDHWGKFKISDIYEHIEHPIARSKKHYESGNIPFIASGAINNGIDCYLAPKNEQDIDKGNCLTISPVDGSCFYQPNDFLGRGGGGSAISILRTNKFLSQATHVFLASIISHTLKEQYSFGNMGNTQKIKDTIIKLPIDAKGEPDWEYMDNQVRHLATLSDLTITSLNPAKLPIFIGGWKKFEITTFYKPVVVSKKMHKADICMDLNVPVYSAGGIQGFVDHAEFKPQTHYLLFGDQTRMFFYVNYPFSVMDNVKVLKPLLHISLNQCLFIQTVASKRLNNIGYSRYWSILKNTFIKLPVDVNGNPDWQYMDQYISWIKQYSNNKLTLMQ